MQLSDNTIFITGGTSGIGRGLAEALHKLGNQVIIGGRRKTLLDEITRANPGMRSIELDIADAASIDRAAATLVADYPALNVLINNAGIMPFDDVSTAIDEATALSTIDTNLIGPIRMTSALVGHLKRQPRAAIVNNTSVVAYVPLATTAVYSATKAALHSYTMSLRFMLRNTNVEVREIAPPWVNTDLIYKSGDPRAMALEPFVAETLQGLAGEREEVLVEMAQAARNNPGPGEHKMINELNLYFVDNPIPVGA
ncbi:SDR family NAD(P)-dependent oxidoreductase [Massilia sp. YIM B02763]|uniref:SDR family oxidoreductase n=1 Tax=Massilia sp. YIM B02763 TaxID=3050130 RepID=UPI0025B63FFC|nr:SDR family NAD(P)-dependent oxidoreductase [Massilia sp. YIM B02763]MDN4055999.1 SDR family NAD(P)-dependent oxidoreductase [Massilia sp. YIM B02763]